MKDWKEMTDKEKTPEAGYREAVRRIEEARKTGAEELDLQALI